MRRKRSGRSNRRRGRAHPPRQSSVSGAARPRTARSLVCWCTSVRVCVYVRVCVAYPPHLVQSPWRQALGAGRRPGAHRGRPLLLVLLGDGTERGGFFKAGTPLCSQSFKPDVCAASPIKARRRVRCTRSPFNFTPIRWRGKRYQKTTIGMSRWKG